VLACVNLHVCVLIRVAFTALVNYRYWVRVVEYAHFVFLDAYANKFCMDSRSISFAESAQY
jgi:hypothetical protein